jgi:peptidoglycan-associated lipoprotein
MSPFRRPARACLIATLGLLGALGCQSLRGRTPQESPGEASAPVARSESHAPSAPSAPPQLEVVYFDFERWELRDDARSALQQNALRLKQSAQWTRLTIEGHCDERGSGEYNLALGERRAGMVSRYLADLGVPASRLATVSYGEDRPAARGHDEQAWQQNRRAELKLEAPRQASR